MKLKEAEKIRKKKPRMERQQITTTRNKIPVKGVNERTAASLEPPLTPVSENDLIAEANMKDKNKYTNRQHRKKMIE